MIFEKTSIVGCFIIRREPFNDNRGSFARVFCVDEFTKATGMNISIMQTSLSVNKKRGTLRGLHAQKGNDAEDKLVACIKGDVFDVCVDVRKASPTYGKYVGERLSEGNNTMLFIPKGCAHGVLTLNDDSVLWYHTSHCYIPNSEIGFHYNDPAFNIQWPIKPTIISEKDNAWTFV